MSLTGPSPTLKQNSEEFKREARAIKKDIRSLRRITRSGGRDARLKPKNRIRHEEKTELHRANLEYENEFLRRATVEDGKDFLLDFLRYHFPDHLDSIAIKCRKTLEEIKTIGNEERSVGVRQCRRLFNAPVLSDEIGLLLWTELRQGDALSHCHEFHPDDEAWMEDFAPEQLERKRTADLEARMTEYVKTQNLVVWNNHSSNSVVSHGNTGYNITSPSPTIKNAPNVDASQVRAVAAVTALVEQRQSVPMDRKAVDGFLVGIKKRTAKGAGYFAASLAAGYS
jgi:hypothetical protein